MWTPAEQDPAVFADMATDVVRYVTEQCDGDYKRSNGFLDLLNTGVMCLQLMMDYDDDVEGEIKLTKQQLRYVWWDQEAREQNLADTRWRAIRKFLHRDDIEARWPDKEAYLVDAAADIDQFDLADEPSKIENTRVTFWQDGAQKKSPARPNDDPPEYLPVSYIEWFEYEDFYRFPSESNPQELDRLPADQWNKLKQRLEQLGQPIPPNVKQRAKRFKYAYVMGSLCLEMGNLEPEGGWTILFATLYWDEKDAVWYGVMRALKDPQQIANKRFAQQMHASNISPKGLLLYKPEAFVNPREVETLWSSPGATIQVRQLSDGMGPTFQTVSTPAASQTDWDITKFAVDSFGAVSGVVLELMGLSEGDQPGITERQRQIQGMTVLAIAFSAFSLYRKTEAQRILDFARAFMPDGRMIRIGGSFDSRAYPLVKDKLAKKYDILMDENPKNPNQKQEIWQMLSDSGVLPVLAKTGAFPLSFVKYLPLPAVVQRDVMNELKQMQASAQQAAMQGPPPKGQGQQKQPDDPRVVEADLALKRAQEYLTLIRAQVLQRDSTVEAYLKTQDSQRQDQAHQSDVSRTTHDIGDQHLATIADAYKNITGTVPTTERYNEPGYPSVGTPGPG